MIQPPRPRGSGINRVVLGSALIALGCGNHVVELPGAEGDLLAGSAPKTSRGVFHATRMTDGFIAVDGDFWRTDLTSGIAGGGFAVWDLGRIQEIHCGVLQGDNNDTYDLTGSEDGATFTPLWSAGPVGKPGMQLRLDQHIDRKARYVRLTARGGDGFYSVGELALYGQCPKDWPPRLVAREGVSEDEAVQWKLVIFGIASLAFLLLNRRGMPEWMWLTAVVPVGLGISVAVDLAGMWPFEEAEQTYVRAVVAAITAALLLREILAPDRYPVHRRVTAATLGVLAVLSVGCYYHFGMPQFRDQRKGQQVGSNPWAEKTWVHPWDMRVYFPVAKYFDELRFDGLYLASVAAHLDNHPGMSPDAVANVHLRDLDTNEMRTARQVMTEIQNVRTHFSPERWEAFKKDMKYFEDVMGAPDYLGSMQDHGGNATPVWIVGAHFLWRNAAASDLTLGLTALIDPLCLILLFFVIARTFGVRVMLVSLIVWGTTDFSRFGTNLMGSTLRADWMVALGLGACALKTKRWALGGGLIAYAGLIRAFPATAAMFLAVPPLWWVVDRLRVDRKLPRWAEFQRAQGPALRAIAGAAGTVLVLVALTSGLFGFSGSWGTWTKKIVMHAEKPNSNHVGLRNLMQFSPDLIARRTADNSRLEPWTAWQELQRQTFSRRRPLFYLGILAYLGAAVVACRRARMDQAAIIGLMMIPVFFYPANYYCHHVFLVPLLATRAGPPRPLAEPEGRSLFALVSVYVLLMGVVQLPTLAEWPDVTYTYQSVILLFAYAAILFPLARAAWRGGPNGEPLGEAWPDLRLRPFWLRPAGK